MIGFQSVVTVAIAVGVGILLLGFALRRALRTVYDRKGSDRPDSPPPAHGRNRGPPGA